MNTHSRMFDLTRPGPGGNAEVHRSGLLSCLEALNEVEHLDTGTLNVLCEIRKLDRLPADVIPLLDALIAKHT